MHINTAQVLMKNGFQPTPLERLDRAVCISRLTSQMLPLLILPTSSQSYSIGSTVGFGELPSSPPSLRAVYIDKWVPPGLFMHVICSNPSS